VDQLEGVKQGAVDADGAPAGAPGSHAELLGQGPVELPGAVAQQRGEAGRDGAFGEEAELCEGVQLGVVILDDLVGGFEF